MRLDFKGNAHFSRRGWSLYVVPALPAKVKDRCFKTRLSRDAQQLAFRMVRTSWHLTGMGMRPTTSSSLSTVMVP
jgi:hypothetical protein